MKAILSFAVTEGYVEKSPMHRVSAAPAGRKLPKTARSDWYGRALELIGHDDVFKPACLYHAMFGIFYYTMIRRRQLKHLKWGDILWTQRAIRCTTSGSKNKLELILPLPKQILSALNELLQVTTTLQSKRPLTEDQVFDIGLHKSGLGKPLTVGMISHAFNMLSKRLGYPISTHRVRHTSATRMLMATNNLKVTSAMLGHSSVALTADLYIHPSISDLRNAQNKLKAFDLP